MTFEDGLAAAGWGLAAIWALHAIAVVRGLQAFRWHQATKEPPSGTEDQDPAQTPAISAILPCRDEAEKVERSVRSLLSQSLSSLEVIIVDDRSTDGSLEILARLAASDPRARVLRVEKLPDGWLGKCHALWVGASHARGEWLLLSDADVVHREPSLLARALDHARRHDLDLLSLLPENIARGAVVRGFFAYLYVVTIIMLGLWAARPGKQSIFAAAAGAFMLVKRRAYDAIGGHQAIRLAVVDDIWVARHVRSAGFRTEARHGEGLLEVEYAGSFTDYLRVSEKNAFALFRYKFGVAATVVFGTLAIHTVGPIALLCFPATWAAAIVVWASIAAAYFPVARTLTEASAHSSSNAKLRPTPFWCFVLHPFYGALSALAIARSMSSTLRRGGVRWRDRVYPLAELRAWHREEERALRLRSSPRASKEESI